MTKLPPKHVGWQITRRDTDDPPPGMYTYEIYTFNTVLTWVLNAHDRPVWRLCPVVEGDVEEPKLVRLNAVEALKLVEKYNKDTGPKEGK